MADKSESGGNPPAYDDDGPMIGRDSAPWIGGRHRNGYTAIPLESTNAARFEGIIDRDGQSVAVSSSAEWVNDSSLLREPRSRPNQG